MVDANGSPKAAGGDVISDFGSRKGVATVIWQVWQGRGRRGGSRI